MFYPLLSTLIYFSSLFSTLRLLNVMKSAILIEMIISNEVIVKIRLIFAMHWACMLDINTLIIFQKLSVYFRSFLYLLYSDGSYCSVGMT